VIATEKVMKTLLLLLAGLNLLLAASSFAADALPPGRGWGFEDRGEALALRLDGQPVAEFVYRDSKILRPFFANVRAPGGVTVTRNHPPLGGTDATDHDTMHPGVWLAFGNVNGQDFWRNKGRIEHLRFAEPPRVENGRLTFATESRLLTTNRQPVCTQLSRFTLAARPAGCLLVWDATFSAEFGDFFFGDEEEMGLGVRVATPLTEKNGGLITSSGGSKTAKDTWGKAHDWCDYSGSVNGQRVGITLMADPANFRPSWFHNRDYGLMVANPFGRKSMNQGEPSRVVVKSGERLRLRFGVLLHSAATPKDVDLAAAYRDFVSEN
jgi:hypothetical protein